MEKKNNRTKTEEADLKRYITIAKIVFLTVCCCTLFFFLLYRYHDFAEYWKNIFGVLQPIIIGLVLAYLLNPIMCFFERYLKKLLEKRMKSRDKAYKMARYIATFGSLIFLIGIITLLVVSIVPSLSNSIQHFAATLPEGIDNLTEWVNDFTKGDTKIALIVQDIIENASETLQGFLN